MADQQHAAVERPEDSAPHEPDASDGDTELRSLVVVSDEELCSVLELQFELEGYQVEVVADGESCLDLLDGCDVLPDVVVFDEFLPRADGTTVARTVHARYGETVAVLLLSGSGDTPDLPIETIEKPVDPTAVTTRVAREA